MKLFQKKIYIYLQFTILQLYIYKYYIEMITLKQKNKNKVFFSLLINKSLIRQSDDLIWWFKKFEIYIFFFGRN